MKMPMRVLALLLVAVTAIAAPAFAQEKSVTRWSVTLSQSAPKVGDEIEVIFRATINPGWIVYASDFKADLGPQPTQFLFDDTKAFKTVGEIISVNPQRKKDKTWDTEYAYFEQQAEFRQKIRVLEASVVVAGRIKGQLCNERDGTCTLFEEKFSR